MQKFVDVNWNKFLDWWQRNAYFLRKDGVLIPILIFCDMLERLISWQTGTKITKKAPVGISQHVCQGNNYSSCMPMPSFIIKWLFLGFFPLLFYYFFYIVCGRNVAQIWMWYLTMWLLMWWNLTKSPNSIIQADIWYK